MSTMVLEAAFEFPDLSQAPMLCIDCETTSFQDNVLGGNPFQGARAFSWAITTCEPEREKRQRYYLPLRHRGPGKNAPLKPALAWLKKTLERPGLQTLAHNAKFDHKHLWVDGIWTQGPILDTMIVARLVDCYAPSLRLESLAQKYLGTGKESPVVKAYLKSIGAKDYALVPLSIMAKYAVEDADLTVDLWHLLGKKLPEASKQILEIETRLTRQLLKAEIRGMAVDVKKIKQTYASSLRSMLEIAADVAQEIGEDVDIGSPTEISKLMLGTLGISPKTFTPTGKPQWTAAALKTCGHPIGAKIAEYKHLKHFSSTYCKGWLERLDGSGRIHGTFHQPGTKTGRMSSKDPNLQNIPPEGEAFVAPSDGCVILGWDYSQLEYRVFAHYANDEKILAMYRSDAKTDFHQALADMLGIPRQAAKTINFAFLYGMGLPKLLTSIAALLADREVVGADSAMVDRLRALTPTGRAAGCTGPLTAEELPAIAKAIYNQYHGRMPSIRQLRQQVETNFRVRGFIRNLYGREYRVPGWAIFRLLNALVQGSAGDLVKERMVTLLEEFTPNRPDQDGIHLLTTVHDSLYLDVPTKDAERVLARGTEILEDVLLRVPLKVDAAASATTWAAARKVDADHALDARLRETLEEK